MIKDTINPVALSVAEIGQYISQFIESIAHKSKETQGTYRRALREFTKFFAVDGKFFFRIRDVERYKTYLIRERGMQEVSVSTYMTAVRTFCQYLVEIRVLEKNPARRVPGGKRPEAHNRSFITLDELDMLLGSIEEDTETGLRDRAIIQTMIGCACSELEITRADISDLQRRGRSWILYVQGKGKKMKDEAIPTPIQTVRAIRAYLDIRSDRTGETDPLFISYSNRSRHERMSVRGVRQAIGQRLKDSGVKKGRDRKLTPFSLRHTAGILMAEAGAAPEELMHRMRIAWRPTAMLYFKQRGKLKSREHDQDNSFIALD